MSECERSRECLVEESKNRKLEQLKKRLLNIHLDNEYFLHPSTSINLSADVC